MDPSVADKTVSSLRVSASKSEGKPLLGNLVVEKSYSNIPRGLLFPETPSNSSKSSVHGVIFSFTNSILGAGVIGLPFALLQTGFLCGIVLLVLGAFMTLYSVKTIITLAETHSTKTFEELGRVAFGRLGYFAVGFFQFTFSFGALCTYLVVIADTVPAFTGHLCKSNFTDGHPVVAPNASWFVKIATNRNLMTTFLVLAIAFPICIGRRFANLAKFAFISMTGVMFFTCCVVVKYFTDTGKYPRKSSGFMYDYIEIHSQILPAIGTIAFAYVCQHQTLLLYSTLLPATPQAFDFPARSSVFISATVAILMAIFGYLTFLGNTRGDIFLNYSDPNDMLIQVCRLIIGISTFLTYPQEFMVARCTIENLLESKYVFTLCKTDDNAISKSQTARCARSSYGYARHVLITIALLTSSLIIALYVRALEDLLNLVGSFSAVGLAFVMPAACHIKLGIAENNGSFLHEHFFPWFVLSFGVVALVASTANSILLFVVNYH